MTSGFSVKWMKKLLENAWGKSPEESRWLAICTTAPTATNTGTTISEPSISGYARKEIKPADLSAASEASPSVIETTVEEIMAELTGAGSAEINGWALCTAATVGDVVSFGTTTPTTVSKTNTPVKVAAKGLKAELAVT